MRTGITRSPRTKFRSNRRLRKPSPQNSGSLEVDTGSTTHTLDSLLCDTDDILQQIQPTDGNSNLVDSLKENLDSIKIAMEQSKKADTRLSDRSLTPQSRISVENAQLRAKSRLSSAPNYLPWVPTDQCKTRQLAEVQAVIDEQLRDPTVSVDLPVSEPISTSSMKNVLAFTTDDIQRVVREIQNEEISSETNTDTRSAERHHLQSDLVPSANSFRHPSIRRRAQKRSVVDPKIVDPSHCYLRKTEQIGVLHGLRDRIGWKCDQSNIRRLFKPEKKGVNNEHAVSMPTLTKRLRKIGVPLNKLESTHLAKHFGSDNISQKQFEGFLANQIRDENFFVSDRTWCTSNPTQYSQPKRHLRHTFRFHWQDEPVWKFVHRRKFLDPDTPSDEVSEQSYFTFTSENISPPIEDDLSLYRDQSLSFQEMALGTDNTLPTNKGKRRFARSKSLQSQELPSYRGRRHVQHERWWKLAFRNKKPRQSRKRTIPGRGTKSQVAIKPCYTATRPIFRFGKKMVSVLRMHPQGDPLETRVPPRLRPNVPPAGMVRARVGFCE